MELYHHVATSGRVAPTDVPRAARSVHRPRSRNEEAAAQIPEEEAVRQAHPEDDSCRLAQHNQTTPTKSKTDNTITPLRFAFSKADAKP